MNDKTRAAMKQALEAIEWGSIDADADRALRKQAITALREALASCCLTTTEQSEQEPVAWANPHDLERLAIDMKVRACGCPLYTVPLYTHPVRTKDLTDDEIADIRMSIIAYEPVEWGRVFARAVIAADRKLNGVEK